MKVIRVVLESVINESEEVSLKINGINTTALENCITFGKHKRKMVVVEAYIKDVNVSYSAIKKGKL